MLLLPLLVRAAPPAFGNIETEYEDCGALLNNFLAKDENTYFHFTLNLPLCNTTDKVALENKRCNLEFCNPSDPLIGDKFPCLHSFCSTVDYMARFPTCKLYVCNPANFWEEYGFAGLLHGDGTMHPCGRQFAMRMIDTCKDSMPDALYPGCGPFGPGAFPSWGLLPENSKIVMIKLGWGQDAWSLLDGIENLPPEQVPLQTDFPLVERTCWGDLTGDQQRKLFDIGWNPEGWVTCGYLADRIRKTCAPPSNVPAEDGSCSAWRWKAEKALWGAMEGDPLGTDRLQWEVVPHADRANWEILGFTNETWNSGAFGGFKLRTVRWSGLTPLERKAAKHFHFNIFTWNGCEHEECLDKLAYAEQFTFPTTVTRRWELLSPTFREWMIVLGWTEMGWSNGEIPIPMTYTWESIDEEVRKRASFFGHDKDTWARCPNSECLSRLKYLKNLWWPVKDGGKPLDWNKMSPQWQRDWRNLGYTMQLWNDKGRPPVYYTSWDALSKEQQQSARSLGYTMSSWDGCANPERTEETKTESGEIKDPFRLVQGKMTIPRSFTEISEGGVVTPAFFEIFRGAVSRAMFCRNEVEKGFDGECYDRDSYERQAKRLLVVRVDQSPVAVHFRVMANRTGTEITSLSALERLSDALEDPSSSIRTDTQFERFARVAQVIEVPFDVVAYNKEQEEIRFEAIRRGDTSPRVVVENGAGQLHAVQTLIAFVTLRL